MKSEPESKMASIDDKMILYNDILIVDDEIPNLRLLADYLGQAGYPVRATEKPQLAIDSALSKPPALILLDVRMPEMDGFEACKRLKQDERTDHIPIIFISALQDVKDRVRGFEVGGVDFISKPFQEEEVLARVRTHMELRNMQISLEEDVAKRTAEVIESEQRFRATFEQAAVGIAHLSPEGHFLRINKMFCDIVGYSEEELLALTFRDITHPDHLGADLANLQQVLNRELETYSTDKRYYRKDGTIVWANLTLSLVFDRRGSPNYFVAVVKDISERKEAEEKLAKSVARYRSLVDNSIVGVFNSTIDGRFKYANDAMAQIFDFETPHQMINQKSLERWSDPGDRNRMLTELRQYGKVSDFEAEAITHIGRKIHVIVSARQIGNDILGIVMDISKRKQAEKALMQSHDFLEHLTSAVPDAIFSIKTPERTIKWVNDSFNVMGYEPEEYIGQSTKGFYANPEDYELVGRLQTEAIRRGDNMIRTEVMALHKDGRAFPAELTATYYRENGKLHHITALIRDISERKQAEEAIRESEKKYRGLVDNSIVGVFTSTLDGRFTFINDAMTRMFDFDSTELMLAKGALERWQDPKDRERMLAKLQKHGSVTNFEAKMITSTDRHIHVLFSAKQVGDNIHGMMMDITKRKKAEQKIIDYQQRLKALASELTIAQEKERRAIAASLHDNVSQSLALARIQIASACKATPDFKLADKLEDISDTLLKSISDTKKLLFELSSPAIHEIGLSSAISEWLASQIEGKHGLQTEFINNIPDNRGKKLDPDVRTILFRNVKELVINVLKHARANKVRVCVEARSPSIKIIVEDDGIGFDPHAVTQAGSKSGGFGLFSVEELMADLGGSLRIVSEPGKGCTAILSAPFIVSGTKGGSKVGWWG